MRLKAALILGVLVLGGCSFRDVKDTFWKVMDRAPEVKIQPVPEVPDINKSCPGSRTFIMDKDGSIISCTPIK